MNYVISILVAIVGVTSVTSVVFWASSSGARKTIEALSKDIKSLRAEMSAYALKAEQEIVNAKQEVARRDTFIASLKDEISRMEKDLATCRDPAVVRERLRKLLSGA